MSWNVQCDINMLSDCGFVDATEYMFRWVVTYARSSSLDTLSNGLYQCNVHNVCSSGERFGQKEWFIKRTVQFQFQSTADLDYNYFLTYSVCICVEKSANIRQKFTNSFSYLTKTNHYFR